MKNFTRAHEVNGEGGAREPGGGGVGLSNPRENDLAAVANVDGRGEPTREVRRGEVGGIKGGGAEWVGVEEEGEVRVVGEGGEDGEEERGEG
ncbi:hypothetical protein MLD38_016001 [Melastoma candidum]|uniref:Uncharacterized protein n=1 Tax=Melastoma candidum TaxID=119954 RepID=A0ACB9RI54_9MYRT|nr:hypothetical protein MLD38_016001 [Melastoma candidum]